MKVNHSSFLLFSYIILSSIFIIAPYSADANNCRLCINEQENSDKETTERIPLRIKITTNLNFSRAAITGRGIGKIAVNENNGHKRVDGELVDLGGYAVAGSVMITGKPGSAIYVDMPQRITMRSNKGGQVNIRALRTDLPPSPRLNLSGELKFSFGGDLIVSGDVSGRFRGRIPITVNYE